MSESTNGPGGDGRPASAEPGEAQPADRLGMLQAVVAILLIISFLAVLALLVVLRGDQHWDRLVYLLSGFEAVVFVAVGAFFGTSAQRGAVVAARQDAATAREEAVSQRDRADAAAQEATAGRVLAQAI
ncbi:MAG TPA: hypothetical protein VES42_18440, partial [Pilimelia sp.]|nr:hypothetical protein [Pilimelia sp.]